MVTATNCRRLSSESKDILLNGDWQVRQKLASIVDKIKLNSDVSLDDIDYLGRLEESLFEDFALKNRDLIMDPRNKPWLDELELKRLGITLKQIVKFSIEFDNAREYALNIDGIVLDDDEAVLARIFEVNDSNRVRILFSEGFSFIKLDELINDKSINYKGTFTAQFITLPDGQQYTVLQYITRKLFNLASQHSNNKDNKTQQQITPDDILGHYIWRELEQQRIKLHIQLITYSGSQFPDIILSDETGYKITLRYSQTDSYYQKDLSSKGEQYGWRIIRSTSRKVVPYFSNNSTGMISSKEAAITLDGSRRVTSKDIALSFVVKPNGLKNYDLSSEEAIKTHLRGAQLDISKVDTLKNTSILIAKESYIFDNVDSFGQMVQEAFKTLSPGKSKYYYFKVEKNAFGLELKLKDGKYIVKFLDPKFHTHVRCTFTSLDELIHLKLESLLRSKANIYQLAYFGSPSDVTNETIGRITPEILSININNTEVATNILFNHCATYNAPKLLQQYLSMNPPLSDVDHLFELIREHYSFSKSSLILVTYMVGLENISLVEKATLKIITSVTDYLYVVSARYQLEWLQIISPRISEFSQDTKDMIGELLSEANILVMIDRTNKADNYKSDCLRLLCKMILIKSMVKSTDIDEMYRITASLKDLIIEDSKTNYLYDFVFRILPFRIFSPEVLGDIYQELCNTERPAEVQLILDHIIKYAEKTQDSSFVKEYFPVHVLRLFSKMFSTLRQNGQIGISHPETNAQELAKLLEIEGITSHVHFQRIVFLLYVACSDGDSVNNHGYEVWLNDMFEIINQNRKDCQEQPLYSDLMQQCYLTDKSEVTIRKISGATIVRYTHNTMEKVINYKMSVFSDEDLEKLNKCLKSERLSRYKLTILFLIDNRHDLIDPQNLKALVKQRVFQSICNKSYREIDSVVFSIKDPIDNIDLSASTIERFNRNGEPILTTMFGYQMDIKGKDIIGKSTATYIQNEFLERIKSGFYCGTAFSNSTNVTLLYSKKILERQNSLNVGLIFNDESVNITDVFPGDAYTKSPKRYPSIYLEGGDTIHETTHKNKNGIQHTRIRNKAFKNHEERQTSTEKLQAITRHVEKHGSDGKLYLYEGLTTTEVNFLPKETNFFDAVDGVIVDLSIFDILPTIYEFDNWNNIVELSNSICKPIYFLHYNEDNKLKLTTLEEFRLNNAVEVVDINDDRIENSSLIPEHLLVNFEEFYKKDSYTPEYPGENGIRNHTNNVIKIFNQHFADTFMESTSFSTEFMRKMLSLHDIGKGNSKNTHKQHANTKDTIKRNRDLIEMDIDELEILVALVEHDGIGKYLSGKFDDEQASLILSNSFAKVRKYRPDLTIEQFWNLANIYYICDMGSYPSLRIMILDNNFRFKPRYQYHMDKLFTSFKHEVNDKKTIRDGVRCFYDYHTLHRDIKEWLLKSKKSFPEVASIVIDVDNTIVKYEESTNKIIPEMIEIMQEIHKMDINIIIVTNRPSTQFKGDKDILLKQLHENGVEVAGFFHNDMTGSERKNFKDGIFRKFNEQIVGAIGDNMHDLIPHDLYLEKRSSGFKPKSFLINHNSSFL